MMTGHVLRTVSRQLVLAAMLGLAAPAVARSGASEPQPPSAELVLAHPEAVSPFDYVVAVQWLWSHGRRQQAAFWFYVFQARTRPWALADTHGDGAAALRSALNDGLGTTINGWIGSDPVAWRMIAERAVSYERHLPLQAERPPELGASDWRALVERSRAEYAAQLKSAFDGLSPESLAAGRRQGGLPVGPLKDAGPPLPDAWR